MVTMNHQTVVGPLRYNRLRTRDLKYETTWNCSMNSEMESFLDEEFTKNVRHLSAISQVNGARKMQNAVLQWATLHHAEVPHHLNESLIAACAAQINTLEEI